jgi:hypothetical protein
MGMVNLAKTPAEMMQDTADMPVAMPAGKVSGPEYPYGCCISLDDESLAKLKLDGDLPQVGEMIHFEALAKVTSASMNERINADGSKDNCCRIELQITDMGVIGGEDEDDKAEARRRRFYGSPDTDNDGD